MASLISKLIFFSLAYNYFSVAITAKDRSLRQLLQGNAIHAGAAEGCDLLVLTRS
jgi:hypothetical protein